VSEERDRSAPLGVPASLLAAALQTALSGYLSGDPEARERFGELAGRAFAVQIQGLDIELYILPDADGITVVTALEREPDVVLTGSPLALARLAGGELTGAGVSFRGDTGMGQRLRELLAGVDFDWEEPLSHLVGDLAAHQIGNVLRGLGRWGGELVRSLLRDTEEYLHEERRELPTREEIERFLDDVDELRFAVDRLEARIEGLRSSAPEPGEG